MTKVVNISTYRKINKQIIKTIIIDENTLIDMFHNIKYKEKGNKIKLPMDRINIKQTGNNNYSIVLLFNKHEEEKYNLVYKMTNRQVKILKNIYDNNYIKFLEDFLIIE